MSKKFMIQVPDSIIRDGKNISSTDFVLYTYLKFQDEIGLTQENKKVVSFSQLKLVMNIKTNATLKNSLQALKNLNLIEYEEMNYTLNSILKFEITTQQKKQYTQLPFSIFNLIPIVEHEGFRLLYYYETYINRKKLNFKAYPSYNKIIEHLNISSKTLSKYNSILEKNKFLTIEKSNLKKDDYSQYSEKYNNKYKINIEKI